MSKFGAIWSKNGRKAVRKSREPREHCLSAPPFDERPRSAGIIGQEPFMLHNEGVCVVRLDNDGSQRSRRIMSNE